MNAASGATLFAGVDEAGRGPLAGPVYAAAVILDPLRPVAGLADSKKLSERAREALAAAIRARALAWAVARAEVDEIDELNILQATRLAMRRAVIALTPRPVVVQVDGRDAPAFRPEDGRFDCRPVIGGDRLIDAISAASILAKVDRDEEMRRLDACFPGYGFSRHKGYGTRVHMEALQLLGPCLQHRRSFAPVRAALQRSSA